ncbi:MAG: RluA family pseudouridine synthase, partial [Verrucomicrobia bacterium]|nr:RluA family pseudouridine synthase [Verrucomicrobiota bacterium]
MSATIKLSSPATSEFWEIAVLYEDEHLLALDKPSGLLTSPDRNQPDRPCLTRLLHGGIERGSAWARESGRTYLMPAHRLDAEISGVMLLAKSKPVLIAQVNWFGVEKPGRKYVALVKGAPAAERFKVEAELAPHPVQAGVMRVDPLGGKHSKTSFEVRERFSRWTLVGCELLTDRPHQIRVHLRHLGFPAVGDVLYGGRPLFLSHLKRSYRLKPNQTERPLLARPAIHAETLSLPHPITGNPLTITAPWPK